MSDFTQTIQGYDVFYPYYPFDYYPERYILCNICGKTAVKVCSQCGKYFCSRHSCMCLQFPSHIPPPGHSPYWFASYNFSTMKSL